MFPPPELITTDVFARLPTSLHQTDRPSQWLADRHTTMHSFLEGPSCDRHGNLWCVDLAHGRLLRISPGGEFEVALQYDGEPNGLKIHRDGRVFVVAPSAEPAEPAVPVEPVVSAAATTGITTTAAPMPRAIAKAPTRPT